MDEFLAAYKAWWQLPFPEGSGRVDLNDLNGDLHVIFEWVLSTVEPFAEHEKIVPVRVDIAAGLRDLRSRLAHLRGQLTGAEAFLADQYLAYLDALDAAYATFRRASGTP
jgi:hypothetical protein